MTSALDLDVLEHEIEEKRQRLARDLDRLRSTETIARVKAELWGQAEETRDRLLSSARDTVSSGIQDLWQEVKSRAAANPAAALALGTGIAWRLIQHPPIASALVGVGLISLWRTDPRHPAPGADLVTRSGELFEAAKHKAADAAEGMQARTLHLRSAASEIMEDTAETVGNAVRASRDTLGAARQATEAVLPAAADTARAAIGRAAEITRSEKERDQILLSVAGLALAAAVGIAAQRRPERVHAALSR